MPRLLTWSTRSRRITGNSASGTAGMKIDLLFDQIRVRQHAIQGVLQEGAIAAGLTALMMLIFLGSWRSMLVVMVAIPLSIMTSIAVLAALGQTINTMTLGGLAWRSAYWSTTARHDRKYPPPFGRRNRNSTRRFWRVPPVLLSRH